MIPKDEVRILFLDDMKRRHDEFRQASIGFVVDFVWDAEEAIKMMKKNKKYTLILLDHDLEREHYQSNEDHHEDGSFVARAMREMENQHGATVIVHSLNPSGRLNIESILKDLYTVYRGPETFRVNEVWKIEVNLVLQALGLIAREN